MSDALNCFFVFHGFTSLWKAGQFIWILFVFNTNAGNNLPAEENKLGFQLNFPIFHLPAVPVWGMSAASHAGWKQTVSLFETLTFPTGMVPRCPFIYPQGIRKLTSVLDLNMHAFCGLNLAVKRKSHRCLMSPLVSLKPATTKCTIMSEYSHCWLVFWRNWRYGDFRELLSINICDCR